jgi:transposase
VIAFAAKLPACVAAMEACCGAHHMGRALAAQGHEVRLMSPEYVRPYVKAQKNDDRDAEAIAEAATRPTMRFVALKSEEQLDMQTLHRVRDRLVAERTWLMNQIRYLLLERGIVVPQERAKLNAATGRAVQAEAPVSSRIQFLLRDLRERLLEITARIRAYDAEFTAQAQAYERAHRS